MGKDRVVQESGKKVVFAEFPTKLAWDVKADAARREMTLTKWLIEAAEDRLREVDKPSRS